MFGKKSILFMIMSVLVFSSESNTSLNKKDSSNKIIYGKKTFLEGGGYIIYADKKKSRDIVSLSDNETIEENKTKITKKIDMPVIYKEKCMSCHGEFGEKSPEEIVDKKRYIAGMNKLRFMKKIYMYKKGKYSLGNGEVMWKVVEDLKPDEIKSIALYISSLEKVKEKKKVIGPQLPNKIDYIDMDKIE